MIRFDYHRELAGGTGPSGRLVRALRRLARRVLLPYFVEREARLRALQREIDALRQERLALDARVCEMLARARMVSLRASGSPPVPPGASVRRPSTG